MSAADRKTVAALVGNWIAEGFHPQPVDLKTYAKHLRAPVAARKPGKPDVADPAAAATGGEQGGAAAAADNAETLASVFGRLKVLIRTSRHSHVYSVMPCRIHADKGRRAQVPMLEQHLLGEQVEGRFEPARVVGVRKVGKMPDLDFTLPQNYRTSAGRATKRTLRVLLKRAGINESPSGSSAKGMVKPAFIGRGRKTVAATIAIDRAPLHSNSVGYRVILAACLYCRDTSMWRAR